MRGGGEEGGEGRNGKYTITPINFKCNTLI